ncbi:hypothetical protein [Steroidobacter cummioxidans]|uniref:hypothetical protein n=1 Tax=Steroidobacter cummioxidans TaxID=1803913 RepID=UPI000E31458E|nr:hypothetical protein [Steroidobacter cummioxidans]
MGTQSIGGALASAEAIVVGRVKEHAEPDYSFQRLRPAAMVVEVTESLKGSLKGDIEIVEGLMCYQSFAAEDLKIGMSYVFPLTEIDLANPDDTFGLMIGSPTPNAPSYKMFVLPSCSHSALLLDGAKLYTNELTSDGGRRLEHYMNLSFLKLLFVTRLFDVWRAIPIIAIVIILCIGFVLVRKRRAQDHRV